MAQSLNGFAVYGSDRMVMNHTSHPTPDTSLARTFGTRSRLAEAFVCRLSVVKELQPEVLVIRRLRTVAIGFVIMSCLFAWALPYGDRAELFADLRDRFQGQPSYTLAKESSGVLPSMGAREVHRLTFRGSSKQMSVSFFRYRNPLQRLSRTIAFAPGDGQDPTAAVELDRAAAGSVLGIEGIKYAYGRVCDADGRRCRTSGFVIACSRYMIEITASGPRPWSLQEVSEQLDEPLAELGSLVRDHCL